MLYDASQDTSVYTNSITPQVTTTAVATDKPSRATLAVSRFFNVDRFAENLSRITRSSSTSKCAKSVRVALQNAGARFGSHPVAASDWGSTLKSIGYREIKPSFDNPQPGDIYIIHRTAAHRYGHIAGYTGDGWVSDFKQKSYDVYRNSDVRYSYYRLAAF